MPGLADLLRNQGDGSIGPRRLSTALGKYTRTRFPSVGIWALNDGLTTAAGATASTNIGHLPTNQGGSIEIAEFVKGAGQTIIVPTHSATGLKVSLDLTSTEGAEYVFGGISTIGKHAYTIPTPGTAPVAGVPQGDFFARLKWSAADVSGLSVMLFGFRKVQAFQTAYTSYTDYFAVGFVTTDGNIVTKTRLNSGTALTVDTTTDWADTETHDVEIRVVGQRATAILDDAFLVVPPVAFDFDQGDVVIPFFDFLHAAAAPGVVEWVEYESGFLGK